MQIHTWYELHHYRRPSDARRREENPRPTVAEIRITDNSWTENFSINSTNRRSSRIVEAEAFKVADQTVDTGLITIKIQQSDENVNSCTCIPRDHWHKRRVTGGKRKPLRKKKKSELSRSAANTKLGAQRIHTVRIRGGNKEYRALRLDTMKATTSYHWAEAEEEVLNKKRSKRITEAKYKARQRFAKVEPALEEQFATGGELIGSMSIDLKEKLGKEEFEKVSQNCRIFTTANDSKCTAKNNTKNVNLQTLSCLKEKYSNDPKVYRPALKYQNETTVNYSQPIETDPKIIPGEDILVYIRIYHPF
ncbi:hypothetical protein PV325_008910, partial [Microctonus aethiopoides]